MLFVLPGVFLLIVPGINGALNSVFLVTLVDKGLGPIEALKQSSVITKGVMRDLFLFWLLVSAINFVGLLAFFVGLFVTIPIIMIAID